RILREQPIQLVISDYEMPFMDGVEFLKLVRERHPHVLRIMLTGDPNPEVIIKSVNDSEVYRFIRKPWSNTMLRVTVYFAFETIQLEDENRRLLGVLQRQLSAMRKLELDFPQLAPSAKDECDAILKDNGELLQNPQ